MIFTPEVDISNSPDVTVSAGLNVNNFPATQSVSGTVNVGNLPATQPISGTVSISGNVSTINAIASTSTVAQVVLTSNTNATALAANANRKKVIIFAPKSTLYIKLGATASSTSFTYIVTTANTTVEITNWAGQIDVLSNTNQTINVTELS